MAKIMGIINITPDSFSDGGKFFDKNNKNINIKKIFSHTIKLLNDGADIIDVGGESTRPGSEKISETKELQRVIPFVKKLSTYLLQNNLSANLNDVLKNIYGKKFHKIPISVDTTKSEVAKNAIKNGATIINDISGGKIDKKMFKLIAKTNCKYILCHFRGKANENTYYKNAINEIICEIDDQLIKALKTGIDQKQIIIDPNLGFSKNSDTNWEIINNIKAFKEHYFQYPLLLGHSRKRFLGGSDKKTAKLTNFLIKQKVDIIRIHNLNPSD